jgi:Escherichia/Staphylococcus phage prohead protease
MENSMRITTRLEIKSLSSMQFEGHGAVFGNVDLGGDVLLPGAFTRTLAKHKSEGTFPAMFWMHDQTRIPGKWLNIEEDDTGLPVKGELAPTDLGKEVHTLLKMDAVGGLSIGYIPTEIDYASDGVRLLKEVELFEVSIVAIPMNPKAQIAHVKSRLSARGEYVPTDKELAELKRDAERHLRSKGFSRVLAMQCAKNLFIELVPSAMPDPKADQQGEPDGQKSQPSATPDELEVTAGLTGFKERLILQDLEASFTRIFRR